MKRIVLALALGATTYGVLKLYKAIVPCYTVATKWDEEYSISSVGCSGIITFKFRDYSLNIANKSFVILQNTAIPDYDPEWVTDGLDEIGIEVKNLAHVGEQAKFAAKYSMCKFKLDDKTAKEIKILGIAYFEKNSNFTEDQLQLIKSALIYRLASA